MSSTFTNHLANEKSPYLLRHKHNLVDWHPWGSEAFEKARSLNRPIFLSVGYSTCHWCYVMERESFENEEIAKILNDNFVSILVDREERPDVDMYYMNFVLTMVRSGGWPMSVFMDPNLVPFMGGSYFPPDDVRERKQVGFRSLLQIIINAWKDNPSLLPQQGKMLQQSMIFPHKVTKDATIPGSLELALKTIEKMYGRFDVTHGGIGGGPKFPQAPLFNMLNTMIAWMGPDSTDLKQKVAVMVDVTLEAMAKGGIRDHIDGGFHRYSVDGEWKIPHFEKMLYDQAQLLALYSDFSLMTDGKYNFILKEQLNYLNNILKHKEGGFYSAEDAVSLSTVDAKEEAEGAFYVWEYSEIEQGLDECEGFNGESAAEVFCKYFNINPEGNVERRYDERNELMKKNVLHMTMTHDEIAKSMNVCPKRLQEKIDGYKSVLGYIRGLRPRAYVDAKIIACYQGLLITGLAKAAKALNCSDTVKMAEECAEFCKKYFEKEEGSMIRCVYKTNNETIENSDSIVYGFSHDYSYLIQGLLDLYSVNGDESLLIRAKKLQNTMNEKLWDEKEKEWGYVLCEDAFSGQTDCFKEERDGAEPAATPIATMNLIRLGAIFDDDSYTEYARKIINGVGKVVALEIQICPTYAIPIMFMENRMTKVVVCGDEGNDLVKEFKNILNSQLLWNGVFIHINKNSKLIENSPVFNDMVKDEKPAVYICVGDSCGLPIHTAEDLKKKMAELSGNVELNDLDRSFLIEESN